MALVDQAGVPCRGRELGARDVEVVIRIGLDLPDERGMRSSRVRFVATDSRLREKTTFCAACQICANFVLLSDCFASVESFSQLIIRSYIVRRTGRSPRPAVQR